MSRPPHQTLLCTVQVACHMILVSYDIRSRFSDYQILHQAECNHELLLAASASALPMTTLIHLELQVLPNIISLPWLRLQG